MPYFQHELYSYIRLHTTHNTSCIMYIISIWLYESDESLSVIYLYCIYLMVYKTGIECTRRKLRKSFIWLWKYVSYDVCRLNAIWLKTNFERWCNIIDGKCFGIPSQSMYKIFTAMHKLIIAVKYTVLHTIYSYSYSYTQTLYYSKMRVFINWNGKGRLLRCD